MFRLTLRSMFVVAIMSAACLRGAAAMPDTPDVSGGSVVTVAQSLTPLEQLLNADGTLNLTTGFSGSVDVSGWVMRTEADGAPASCAQEIPTPIPRRSALTT